MYGAPARLNGWTTTPTQRAASRTCGSREPLWQQPGLREDVEAGRYYLPGAPTGRRETIVTSPIEAAPQYLARLPGPGWTPVLAAVFTAAFFLLLTVKLSTLALLCGVLAVAMMLVWMWSSDPAPVPPVDIGGGVQLPTYASGSAVAFLVGDGRADPDSRRALSLVSVFLSLSLDGFSAGLARSLAGGDARRWLGLCLRPSCSCSASSPSSSPGARFRNAMFRAPPFIALIALAAVLLSASLALDVRSHLGVRAARRRQQLRSTWSTSVPCCSSNWCCRSSS